VRNESEAFCAKHPNPRIEGCPDSGRNVACLALKHARASAISSPACSRHSGWSLLCGGHTCRGDFRQRCILCVDPTPEALGAYFRIGAGGGFTGVLVEETWASPTIHLGNVTDGALVNYGACRPDRFEIVRLTYQVYGTSPPCSYLEVLPYPGDSSVLVVTCAGGEVATKPWGPLWVNYTPQCGAAWCVLATESSSWGKIKALYR